MRTIFLPNTMLVNRDVRLLLSLLGSGSGLATPVRALALVDPQFSSALVPDLVAGRAGLLRPATRSGSLLATMQTMAGVRTSFILERPGTGATEYFTHR